MRCIFHLCKEIKPMQKKPKLRPRWTTMTTVYLSYGATVEPVETSNNANAFFLHFVSSFSHWIFGFFYSHFDCCTFCRWLNWPRGDNWSSAFDNSEDGHRPMRTSHRRGDYCIKLQNLCRYYDESWLFIWKCIRLLRYLLLRLTTTAITSHSRLGCGRIRTYFVSKTKEKNYSFSTGDVNGVNFLSFFFLISFAFWRHRIKTVRWRWWQDNEKRNSVHSQLTT